MQANSVTSQQPNPPLHHTHTNNGRSDFSQQIYHQQFYSEVLSPRHLPSDFENLLIATHRRAKETAKLDSIDDYVLLAKLACYAVRELHAQQVVGAPSASSSPSFLQRTNACSSTPPQLSAQCRFSSTPSSDARLAGLSSRLGER